MDALTKLIAIAIATSLPVPATTGAVRTIAGTGAPGIADGAADAATFLIPEGVAVAKNGSIAIADSGAQRVRLLANGTVSTIAGSGAMRNDWDLVQASPDLGTATSARLGAPSGLAYLADGTLLIADSGHHCIRALRDGKVEAFAGSLNAGVADGTRETATFVTPNALAVDADGNVFVADLQGGVREISGDTVSTLALPAAAGTNAVGVATFGSGASERIFASTYAGLVVFDAARQATLYGPLAEGNRKFGYPAALVALRGDAVAFSDPRDNTVRVFRTPVHAGDLPSVEPMNVDAVEDGAFAGAAYAGTALRGARFDVPQGLARAQNGDFIVADTGNRRIRRIDGAAGRLPHVLDAEPLPSGHTWIVGGPPSYFDTLWTTSIAFLLGAQMPATNTDSLLYDDTNVAAGADALERVAKSARSATIWLVTTRDLDALGASAISARARAIATGAPFVVATLPLAGEVASRRDFSASALAPAFDFVTARAKYRALVAAVHDSGTTMLDLAPALAAETSHDDPYATLTPNLSEGGRQTVARALATYLDAHRTTAH